MRSRFGTILLFIFLWIAALPSKTLALDGEAIQTLKAAGVEDAVIDALIEHRSIETGQLTVDEVVRLKKAGLGAATLKEIINRGSFVAGRSDKVYGADAHGIQFLTVRDLLRLKEAGIGEKTLQALVAGSGPNAQDAETRRAWRMLENWGVVIDRRD